MPAILFVDVLLGIALGLFSTPLVYVAINAGLWIDEWRESRRQPLRTIVPVMCMTVAQQTWWDLYHFYGDCFWRSFRVITEGFEWRRLFRHCLFGGIYDVFSAYWVFPHGLPFGLQQLVTPGQITGAFDFVAFGNDVRDRFLACDAYLRERESRVFPAVKRWVETHLLTCYFGVLATMWFHELYVGLCVTCGTRMVSLYSTRFWIVPVAFRVFLEEVLKIVLFKAFGLLPFWATVSMSYYAFALVELAQKVYSFQIPLNIMVCLPVLMHFVTGHISFTGGIMLHTVWNWFWYWQAGVFPMTVQCTAMLGNRRLKFPDERDRDLIRRKIRAGDRVDFSSKNFHPRKNRDMLVELLGGKTVVKLRGHTCLDGHEFAFPFVGTAREFLRALDVIAEHPDRRDLCLYGFLSRELYLAHPECFFQPAERCDFDDDVNMLGLTEDASTMLSSVEEVSFVADVIYKISRKDWVGLAFSGGMKARAMANLLLMVNLTSVQQLGELVALEDAPVESMGEVSMLGLSESVLDFIPKKYSASPNFRRLLALVCLISMAPFVRDAAFVRSISEYVKWDTLPSGQSFMETSLNGASALYNVVGNAINGGGSLADILGMPKNVAFITKARALSTKDFSNCSLQEVEMALVEISELQESRKFLYNDAEINKLKDRLEKTTNELLAMVRNANKRTEPMFIGLLGVPGTGKTTIMTVLCDVLRRVMKLEPKPNDVINYNITDKFAIESCKFPDKGLFLLLNDVPSNYSAYRQLDMLPLDILLQRVIDTSPLDFRSADVPDKGVLVNHLSHVILSSNEKKFAGAEDSKKLLRRVGNGITVWMTFKHEGKLVDFDDLPKNMTESERNDCVRFTVCKPYSKNVAFGFEETQVTVGLHEFLRMVVEKHFAHQEKLLGTAAKFASSEAKCVCGTPHVLHWTQGEYKAIFPGTCDKDGKLCRELVVYKPTSDPTRWELFKSWLFPKRVTMKSLAVVSSWSFTWLWSLLSTYACWLLYSSDHRAQVQGLYDVFRLGRRSSWLDVMMSFPLLRSTYLLHAVVWKPKDFERRQTMIYVAETIIKLRRFVIDNRKILLGGMAALSLYWLMGRTSSTPEMRGQAIFRDQVDPKSMFVYQVEREQRWTPEQQRTWGKDESFIDVVKLVKTGVGADDMIKCAHSALRKVEVRTPDCQVVKGNAVMWNANWVSVNKHFLKHVVPGGQFSVKIDGVEILYEEKEARAMENCEHVLLRNYFDTSVRCLSDYLPEAVGTGPWFAYLTYNSQHVGASYRPFKEPDTKVIYPAMHVPVHSADGDCGNLLLINSPKGFCVGGILSAGLPTPDSWYSIITRSSFSGATSQVPFPEVHDYIKEVPSMLGLSANSEFRQPALSSPLLKVLGTLAEPTRSFRTKFVRTAVFSVFEKKLKQPYGPPRKVKGLTSNGEYKSSVLHTFKYIGMSFRATDTLLLRAGMRWFNKALPVDWVKEKGIVLRPADVGEAVFGDPSIGMDRVNFNSSCGREWKEWGIQNKFDLFDEIEPGKFVMKSVFRDALAELLVHYSNGDIPILRVDFARKDELRTLDKIDEFAIRDFSVVGFHRNLLQRAFLMPIILVLLGNPLRSECFGQMNAASYEWSALADYIRRFPNYIDLDFSKMDTSHRLQMIELVARLFYLAALRLGYMPAEASVAYMSVRALSLQLMVDNNDVAFKMFGLPSGVVITLIMNSIVNSVLMRMAFDILCPELVFEEHVSPATTGDDNFSGISDAAIGRFNMRTLVALYEQWGYVITPAKKDAELRSQLPFEEGTFLKRRFVWSSELNAYLAPIDTDSIYKALCWQSKEGNVHPNVRLQQVALGCQREAFMHGRAFFDQMQRDLKTAFVDHQIGDFYTPLDYDELKTEFHEKRFRTWML